MTQPIRGERLTTPSTSSLPALLAVSVLIYAVAFWTMVLLHEVSHAVAAVLLGGRPVLHPTSVQSDLASRDDIIVALTGPFFSLLLGLALLGAQRAVPALGGRRALRLFLIWLTVLNLYEFVGYLMTAPFLTAGDIRSALDQLNAPAWVSWPVFLAGLAGWVALGRLATVLLLEAAGPRLPDAMTRLRFLGIFTWFAGSALILLLQSALDGLPAYSFWAIVAAGSYTSMVLLFLPRVRPRAVPAVLTPRPWIPLTILVVLLLVQLIWLKPGLHLG